MREAVRKRLNANPAGWVYRDKYLPADSKKAVQVVGEDAMDVT
jgi:hypothetical protein